MDKLSALIWDSSLERRNSLKLLLKNTERYAGLANCSTSREVITKLEEERWDVVLLPSTLDLEKIAEFVSDLKQVENGDLAVLIASVAPDDQNPSSIALRHTAGVHSCLMEPYSVDDVVEVTAKAFSLREKLQEDRNIRAVNTMLEEAMKYLDLISTKMKVDIDPGAARRSLKQTAKAIQTLRGDLRDIYLNLAVQKFIEAPIPDFIPGVENYNGTSPALSRRAEKRRQAIREGCAKAFDEQERAQWAEAQEQEDGSVTPPSRG